MEDKNEAILKALEMLDVGEDTHWLPANSVGDEAPNHETVSGIVGVEVTDLEIAALRPDFNRALARQIITETAIAPPATTTPPPQAPVVETPAGKQDEMWVDPQKQKKETGSEEPPFKMHMGRAQKLPPPMKDPILCPEPGCNTTFDLSFFANCPTCNKETTVEQLRRHRFHMQTKMQRAQAEDEKNTQEILAGGEDLSNIKP